MKYLLLVSIIFALLLGCESNSNVKVDNVDSTSVDSTVVVDTTVVDSL